ncbi:response regulator [Xanthocytophaga agilis]|uniref:Response regulator n=1 Tax=Xanthocytophaga agilis TaxID=3048010 RepID=A0AAE3RE87_9BACT|nr:response regulator [Xanthocytophaga agilis]MDJ1506647.1 response regulator [Xanthocytophaga agilis]
MKKTILLVDDEVISRTILTFILQREGYQVLTAIDGLDAQGHLQGKSIDLIITDLNMPNMDGITLIGEIRIRDAYKYTPIVLFTSESEWQKKKAIEAGANGSIDKSFQTKQILTTIKAMIN